MGESLVESPAVEEKMDASRLEVSVSFGRFENDALSWEKWSSFSPNKYLEEVGNLSAPGSVAQKKAYFEAHYKRVAVKKAEQLEHEKSMEPDTRNSDELMIEGHLGNSSEIDNKSGICNGEKSAEEIATETCMTALTNITISDEIKDDDARLTEGVEQKKEYFEAHHKRVVVKKAEQLEHEKSMEPATRNSDELIIEGHLANSSEIDNKSSICNDEKSAEEIATETCMTALTNITILDEAKDDDARSTEGVEQEACTNGLMDVTNLEEEKEDAVIPVECGNSTVDVIKEEVNGNIADPEINAREEEVLAAVETPAKDSSKIMKKPPESKNGVEQSAMLKKEVPNLNARNKIQEVTPTKREKMLAGTKKKVVSPAVKPSQASTPKYSRPTSISTPISVPHSLKKKVNGSSLPKSNNYTVEGSKRAAPTSLHMSLSLGTANSSSALTMTRKSLIMERMGDKDIVKRAFKTFQNPTNGSPTNGKSSTLKQASSPTSDPKISAFSTPRKEHEGLRKEVGKTTTQRSQSGTRLKHFPSGSHKSPTWHPKNAIPVSPSVSLKSGERAEKWKEFLKNLEAKSIARKAENVQVSEKSKEEKKPEIKKLRQSLNFNATPMPSFYRNHRKGHSEKEGAGNKIHNQPPSI